MDTETAQQHEVIFELTRAVDEALAIWRQAEAVCGAERRSVAKLADIADDLLLAGRDRYREQQLAIMLFPQAIDERAVCGECIVGEPWSPIAFVARPSGEIKSWP